MDKSIDHVPNDIYQNRMMPQADCNGGSGAKVAQNRAAVRMPNELKLVCAPSRLGRLSLYVWGERREYRRLAAMTRSAHCLRRHERDLKCS